jgi:large subunit ribosomal protein L18
MIDAKKKRTLRIRRHHRLRKKVHGTLERPRLVVFKSLKHFYAQAINDINGTTIASASSLTPDLNKGGGTVKVASAVGEIMAANCKKAGITRIVFDHGGFGYRGKIKAFAETLRKNGLEF